MKKNLELLLCFIFCLTPFLSHAQWTSPCTNNTEYTTGNVGINSGCPASPLSINGPGNPLYTSYIESNSIVNGARGLFVNMVPFSTPGITTRLRGITSSVPSGDGWTFGIEGVSSNSTPSSAGRAYGVYGVAGNATSNFNYGVFGFLSGSNAGTGVLGLDNVNFNLGAVWSGSTTEIPSLNTNFSDYWAGYFVGDVEVTNRMGIGCNDFTYTSSTNEPYRFFVNGGALCTELSILGTGWCDYVFDNDYDLWPLEEVEKFIEVNGHLPKTPSAKEIDEIGGIEIGATTLNQQEKIEEIYLHLIEMKKEIKALQKENSTLKKQVNDLSK